jgi:hypothetical protein
LQLAANHQDNWNGQQLITKKWAIESTAHDPTDTRLLAIPLRLEERRRLLQVHVVGYLRDGGGYA